MNKNPFYVVNPEAFKEIVKGAGIVLSEYDPSAPGTVDKTKIICTTTGGIQVSAVDTYKDDGEDLDNVPSNMMEFKRRTGKECKISFTATTANADALKLYLGGANVSGNKITPKMELETTDFLKKIWVVAKRGTSGAFAACLKNVLSDGGLSMQTTDDGNGKCTVSLLGHYSIDAQDEVPLELYVMDDVDAT